MSPQTRLTPHTTPYLRRTGLGDETAVVPCIHANEVKGMESSREEFAATCFPCVAEVLEKTGIKATDINFVVRGVCWVGVLWDP